MLCLLAAPIPALTAQTPADPTPGTLAGSIVDTQNALIPNAHIQLTHPAAAVPTQQTLSTPEGHFHFDQVPPGAFTLSVTMRGFVATTITGNLLPGQTLDLQPIALKPAAQLELQVLPNAPYTPEQQLHVEEQQRLIGLFPNFFVSYQWNAPPLTAGQKFRLATRNAVDPGNLALVGTVAGFQQAANSFPGYGQGAAGYGRRYGADLGNLVAGTYMGGAVFPSLFHQDPRYFYKGTGSTRSRLVYAISRAIICRGDNGHNQPNFAGIIGDLSAGAISNLYYPASDRHGAGITFYNGLLAIGGDAVNGIFQEFFSHALTPSAKHQRPSSTP